MKDFGVIVAYRSAAEASRMAEDLLRTGLIDGVVIVDNSASITAEVDDFVAVRRDQRVHIEEPAVNLGYARGNNLGTRVAAERGADRVLILNPDVRFDRDGLAALLAHPPTRPATAVISPSLREGPGVLSRPGFDTWFGRGLLTVDADRSTHVPTFFGAAFLARTDAFLALGALDEDLFLYCEEVAFVLGARSLMAEPVFEVLEDVVFEHGRGGTISPSGYGRSRRSTVAYEETARSVVIVGRKYLRARLPVWVAVRLVLACSMAPRQPRAALAVLRGLIRGFTADLGAS